MRKLLLVIAALLAMLTGCDQLSQMMGKEGLVGSWESTGEHKETLIFHSDGRMDIRGDNGTLLSEASGIVPRWEAVTEVEPYQLYTVLEVDGETHRTPMLIYKIEGGKLVTRSVITYQRTLGGIPYGGVSRYEIPSDFSGVVNVYRRAK